MLFLVIPTCSQPQYESINIPDESWIPDSVLSCATSLQANLTNCYLQHSVSILPVTLRYSATGVQHNSIDLHQISVKLRDLKSLGRNTDNQYRNQKVSTSRPTALSRAIGLSWVILVSQHLSSSKIHHAVVDKRQDPPVQSYQDMRESLYSLRIYLNQA